MEFRRKILYKFIIHLYKNNIINNNFCKRKLILYNIGTIIHVYYCLRYYGLNFRTILIHRILYETHITTIYYIMLIVTRTSGLRIHIIYTYVLTKFDLIVCKCVYKVRSGSEHNNFMY